jgi:hypothetical protein
LLRVLAVNSVFIGISNELGAFESGLTAAFFGPMIAVAIEGLGTIAVVFLVTVLTPEIRYLDSLNDGLNPTSK